MSQILGTARAGRRPLAKAHELSGRHGVWDCPVRV